MSSKLREALGKIAENIDRTLSILNEIPESCSHNGLVEDVADVLCLIKETYITEALAEPIRNCDVGTAEEQTERYRKFCSAHKYLASDFTYLCKGFGKGRCPFSSSHTKSQCEFAWAQMPYKEGGTE